MTPVKRDTTILGAMPGNGSYHDPEGIFYPVNEADVRMAGISVATKESRYTSP
jgi:hypothetical protein